MHAVQAASEKVLTDNRDFKSMQVGQVVVKKLPIKKVVEERHLSLFDCMIQEKKNEEARQKMAAVNKLREEIQVQFVVFLRLI